MLIKFIKISCTIFLLVASNAVISQQHYVQYDTYGMGFTEFENLGRNEILNNEAEDFRIIIPKKIFNDKHILPYEKLVLEHESNNYLSLVGTPGEVESTTLVLQAGSNDINQVTIRIPSIKGPKGEFISTTSFDLRIVKAWYQSSLVMRRDKNSTINKYLLNELLVHDDDLVHVDHVNKTNKVRKNPHIKDADSLVDFDVHKNSNKQIWIDLKLPGDIRPDTYIGNVYIDYSEDGERKTIAIDLSIRVLPFQLEDSKLIIGSFYLGRLTKPKYTYYNSRGKSERQMQYELDDMFEHGVRYTTIDHDYKNDPEAKIFSKQLDIFNLSKFNLNNVVYLDWGVYLKESSSDYEKKLKKIQRMYNKNRANLNYIYNQDEARISDYLNNIQTFILAEKYNIANMVAVKRAVTANKLSNLLDVVLLQHKTKSSDISRLKKQGLKVLAYGLPHAGEEKPETVRSVYGFDLIKKGFDGAFSYAYQAGACWDDWNNWDKSNYRSNVMAYPTIDKPVPTLQWKAWREAVDDVRYLSTYANFAGLDIFTAYEKLNLNDHISSKESRAIIIESILSILDKS